MEYLGLIQLLCVFLLISAEESDHKVCERPELPPNVEVDGLQRFFNPGARLLLSCKEGYTPIGPRLIVCTDSGAWTTTKMKCRLVECPYPGDLSHGDVKYTDNAYQSTVNYTCNTGYTLFGSKSAFCLANGTWSPSLPECKPVSCGLAPIPQFGMIIYSKVIIGDKTPYGTVVTFKCLPPYALLGNTKAQCTAQGTWTETPECRVVTCPPPQPIDQGYQLDKVTDEYFFSEKVAYECTGEYVLEGNPWITCQSNGQWSQKPSCKAPCSVGIKSGRILYKGKKIWIEALKPNRVSHTDLVSVYCLDETRKCGYAVSSQCIDGNLIIPDCFQEPNVLQYNFQTSLPSEMQQC